MKSLEVIFVMEQILSIREWERDDIKRVCDMRLVSCGNCCLIFCLRSASGASVVAIDNKIEQAMVSFP